jgi:hypothetical protein
LVLGNPEGFTFTVSDGIISAFRENRAFIQITAPISAGSSGSPVLDVDSGQVLGIAVGMWREGQNLNFAIPSEKIRDVIAKTGFISQTPPPVVVTPPTPKPPAWKPPTADFLAAAERDLTQAWLNLSPQQRNALRQEERNWIKLKDSIPIDDRVEVVRQRTLYLRALQQNQRSSGGSGVR